ncbi:MAG: hypothetical protein UDQ92_00120 [Lachnospiraceae bacterium]|nr:hypothetical protein [Lachnospiraceae bacterium]
MEDRYEELMKEEFAPVYKTDASVNRTILEREKAVSMKNHRKPAYRKWAAAAITVLLLAGTVGSVNAASDGAVTKAVKNWIHTAVYGDVKQESMVSYINEQGDSVIASDASDKPEWSFSVTKEEIVSGEEHGGFIFETEEGDKYSYEYVFPANFTEEDKVYEIRKILSEDLYPEEKKQEFIEKYEKIAVTAKESYIREAFAEVVKEKKEGEFVLVDAYPLLQEENRMAPTKDYAWFEIPQKDVRLRTATKEDAAKYTNIKTGDWISVVQVNSTTNPNIKLDVTVKLSNRNKIEVVHIQPR